MYNGTVPFCVFLSFLGTNRKIANVQHDLPEPAETQLYVPRCLRYVSYVHSSWERPTTSKPPPSKSHAEAPNTDLNLQVQSFAPGLGKCGYATGDILTLGHNKKMDFWVQLLDLKTYQANGFGSEIIAFYQHVLQQNRIEHHRILCNHLFLKKTYVFGVERDSECIPTIFCYLTKIRFCQDQNFVK